MATPRLPQLKRRGLLLFRLFGWPLAGFTLATLVAAPFVALDSAVAAWGPLGTAFGVGSGAVALAAAFLLLLRRPRDPVAALLSVAFLGIGVGSGPSGLTLAALGVDPVAEVLRLAGFGALFIGVFVFPAGRFEPRWSLWGSLAALAWVMVGLTVLRDSNPRPTHYEDSRHRDRHAHCVQRCTSSSSRCTPGPTDRRVWRPRRRPRGPAPSLSVFE